MQKKQATSHLSAWDMLYTMRKLFLCCGRTRKEVANKERTECELEPHLHYKQNTTHTQVDFSLQSGLALGG